MANMLTMYTHNKEVDVGSFIYDKETIKVSVKDIAYNPTNDTNNHYIKFNLIDTDGDYESVWGLVSKADYHKYNNSNCKEYITVVLANYTLSGLRWGSVFPLKLLGDKKPFFDIKLVDENQVMYIAKSNE